MQKDLLVLDAGARQVSTAQQDASVILVVGVRGGRGGGLGAGGQRGGCVWCRLAAWPSIEAFLDPSLLHANTQTSSPPTCCSRAHCATRAAGRARWVGHAGTAPKVGGACSSSGRGPYIIHHWSHWSHSSSGMEGARWVTRLVRPAQLDISTFQLTFTTPVVAVSCLQLVVGSWLTVCVCTCNLLDPCSCRTSAVFG